MGIVAVISGIAAILCLALTATYGIGIFMAGLGLGAVAIVLGAFDRAKSTGKAGLVLGLLAVAGGGLLFLMFRASPVESTVQPTSVPPATSVPAMH